MTSYQDENDALLEGMGCLMILCFLASVIFFVLFIIWIILML